MARGWEIQRAGGGGIGDGVSQQGTLAVSQQWDWEGGRDLLFVKKVKLRHALMGNLAPAP